MAMYKRYIPPKPSKPPGTLGEVPQPIVARSLGPSPAPAALPQPNGAPQADQNVEAKPKRKRDRSESEVAERKAKKLRKKGVPEAEVESVLSTRREEGTQAQGGTARDGEPSGQQQRKGARKHVPVAVPRTDAEGEAGPVITRTKTTTLAAPGYTTSAGSVEEPSDAQAEGSPASGDFSHVRNKKKRHKLEKEARKARRATEKGEGQQDSGVEKTEKNGVLDDMFEAAGRSEGAVEGDLGPADSAQDVVMGGRVESPPQSETATPKKPKKTKREKRQSQDDDDTDVNMTEARDSPPEAPSQQEEALPSQPKKRRHKLESILQPPSDTPAGQETDSDAGLSKHGPTLSKYQKATKHAQSTPSKPSAIADAEAETEPLVLHDPFVPLPQPQKAATPEFNPEYSSLPKWLARPTIISDDTRSSFSSLGLNTKTVQYLKGLGFGTSLPVQSALIPLLLPPGVEGSSWLPGTEPVLPDLAVGAATGSGKTLAYLLPILAALAHQGPGVGALRSIVVVPTRELVAQVAAVAETLAKGIAVGVKVGTAAGGEGRKLHEERERLIKRGLRYDPDGYSALVEKAHKLQYPQNSADSDASDEEDVDLEDEEDENTTTKQALQDVLSSDGLVNQVPTYHSRVDVLICTPGRLLEHLTTTPGFHLRDLSYLVFDEADKLLDQNYDGFVEMLNRHLEQHSSADTHQVYPRRVRKLVCSATMTRDVRKLAELKLYRPKMVVVQSTGEEPATVEDATAGDYVPTEGVKQEGDMFEIPPTLSESMVPVGDGAEKPLYLVKLLEEHIMDSLGLVTPGLSGGKIGDRSGTQSDKDVDDDGSDGTDSESEESSVLSSSSSDPSSSENEDEDASSASSADEGTSSEAMTTMHPARAALLSSNGPAKASEDRLAPTVLIFTSSTESATRLSHLLCKLKPEWAACINTLTKTARPSRPTSSRDTSKQTRPIVTISTDRAARGLDDLQGRRITHVLQYDVPRSLPGYVHRAGRTARAGRSGGAWTFYTHSEAAWFLREIVRSKNVRRRLEVEKVKIEVPDEGTQESGLLRRKFTEVLEGMREEVHGREGGRGR